MTRIEKVVIASWCIWVLATFAYLVVGQVRWWWWP